MTDKKKLAAISAVISMISGDEQTSAYVEKQVPNVPTTWSGWGRQQTMQYRDITQRRIIKRNK